MCQDHLHKEVVAGEKHYRLSDYFNMWWDEYKQHPSEYITPEQYKAVNALRVCRTEALGVDYYACPECGDLSAVYHSCKNRFCPTCSWKDTMNWGERVKEQMLDLPHRHVVMTLPHGLNSLIKDNKYQLLSLLFRSAAATFKDWFMQKYGIQPGIISVLHTFGETKEYHCHVHMIVSWGGHHKASGSLQRLKGEYVDYKFLQNKFRIKFESGLITLNDRGELHHGYVDRIAFMRFLKSLNDKRWILHLEPAMEIPLQVIRYIGRYSKRACISETKITEIDGEYISFRYKDYKSLTQVGMVVEKEMRLHYRDFYPRLLQHVPLKGFSLVRYYGVYACRSTSREEWKYRESEEDRNLAYFSALVSESFSCPKICQECHIEKVYVFTILKRRNENSQVVFDRTESNRKIPDRTVA